jgi:hypothetical protein
MVLTSVQLKMEGPLNEISSLFDSFYNKFILRDIFAKITPGIIVIFVALYYYQGSIHGIVCFLKSLSAWQWFLLPLAWIMGFFLQGLGLMFNILEDPTYKLSKSNDENKKEELAARFDKKVHISVRDDKEYGKLLERAIIIKETCGNAGMALIFAGVAYIYRHYKSLLSFRTLIVLGLLTILFCVLIDFHIFQSKREEGLRDAYERYCLGGKL